jgi:hypothetical protein
MKVTESEVICDKIDEVLREDLGFWKALAEPTAECNRFVKQ